jgi:hypothetical protein
MKILDTSDISPPDSYVTIKVIKSKRNQSYSIFHSVCGDDRREEKAPGDFNLDFPPLYI